jgi:hypothetical protein
MAALVPMDGVPAIRHMLSICTLTVVQRDAIMDTEGIQSVAMLTNITLGDVNKMTENLSRLPINRGGAYIGTGATTNIKALIWWAQDIIAQGLIVDPNDWDEVTLDDSRQRMVLQKQARDKSDDVIDAPKKLDPSKWVDSYLAFINFLRTQRSADGKRTLEYVVRKPMPPGWLPTSRDDRLQYNAPLVGPYYTQDNQKVYRVTKQWTLNSTAFAWVRPYDNAENGRAAVAAMRDHYDGPGETAKKLARAEAELKTIHYRNEQSMTFEHYVNKLNEIFFVFAEAKQPLTHDQKVRYLCEKISTSNTKLETAMTVIKMDQSLKVPPEDYFVKAANSLAEQIAIIFPNAKPRSSRYVSGLSGRGRGGGRGGGRGRGRSAGRGRGHRGGRRDDDFPQDLGGNPGDKWNGHDISDLTIYFPKNVFTSFPVGLKTKIHHAKNSGSSGGPGKRNINVVQMDDMRSQVSTLQEELVQVRAVMQASRDNDSSSGELQSASSAFGRPGQPPNKKSKGR